MRCKLKKRVPLPWLTEEATKLSTILGDQVLDAVRFDPTGLSHAYWFLMRKFQWLFHGTKSGFKLISYDETGEQVLQLFNKAAVPEQCLSIRVPKPTECSGYGYYYLVRFQVDGVYAMLFAKAETLELFMAPTMVKVTEPSVLTEDQKIINEGMLL